ncbi:hypothetical protein RRG08_030898 [Elysia crispata]|uniref:Uncharacterized protein n=1 Tax=Elysia crispata TaxID=231223 RepID=A0AAE1AGW5_9GAST|nr:hypothetical protein RRG08_030898 [Elysia crispata]
MLLGGKRPTATNSFYRLYNYRLGVHLYNRVIHVKENKKTFAHLVITTDNTTLISKVNDALYSPILKTVVSQGSSMLLGQFIFKPVHLKCGPTPYILCILPFLDPRMWRLKVFLSHRPTKHSSNHRSNTMRLP